MKRSSIAWFVVMALVLPALAGGCSKETGGGSAGERVTLKVEIFDRGSVPEGAGTIDKNFMTDWVQKNFGEQNNIDMEYIPIPRSKEVDQLNVLMAAANAPDLVFSYNRNTVFNYVEQGGLTDLGPYIDSHGPDLKAFLGEEVLKNGMFSGKQYTIPARVANPGKMAHLIRKDWLDQLGLPVPTTKEEFFNVLMAFKEKDPGGMGKDVIPYGGSFNTLSGAKFAFATQFSGEGWYADNDLAGNKEFVRFLNKLFNAGLISKEWMLDKDQKRMYADIIAGKVGFFTENLGLPLKDSPGLYDNLKKTVPTAELADCDPFDNPEGKHPKVINPPDGMKIMVPKFSKRAAEVVKYLNWMSQPDVLFTLQNGIEGQNYNMVDGFPVPIVTEESNKTFWFYLGFDLGIISNGTWYQDPQKRVDAAAKLVPGYEELYMANYASSIRDGVILPVFDRPIKSEIKYGPTLTKKREEQFIKSIIAKPDEFDQIYDAFEKELDSLGRSEIIAEKIEAYRAMAGE